MWPHLTYIGSIIPERKKVWAKGSAEINIWQKLSMLKELITEFDLNLHADFLLLERNKADALTQIKENWMKIKEGAILCCLGYKDLKLQCLHAVCGGLRILSSL